VDGQQEQGRGPRLILGDAETTTASKAARRAAEAEEPEAQAARQGESGAAGAWEAAGMAEMRLLDLYCGAGGAAMGYHRAGFSVVGVDHVEQPRYPFKFHCADALEFCRKHGREYDVIHASPPCQGYSRTRAIWKREHKLLVAPTRALMIGIGKPYIIEMVTASPLEGNVIVLCGEMFGLKVFRHRWFETSVFLLGPPHPKHNGKAVKVGRRPSAGDYMTVAGHFSDVSYARQCMGIDWMTREELSQAIPPAYTEFIGRQLVEILRRWESHDGEEATRVP
jgi:DNA (cytosine-5)-methyltransferase 1